VEYDYGMDPDDIDRRVEDWAKELPELDPMVESIVERIQKITKHLDRLVSETAAEAGLAPGEFKVLLWLRGHGPPYRMSPTHLADRCGCSSGAMTNRLDNLEKAGLVLRTPDPGDRRGLLVELSSKGQEVLIRLLRIQAQKERILLSALGDEEKAALEPLLRTLYGATRGAVPAARA
jgi:DNA-binding MarR family transcriptional regulator